MVLLLLHLVFSNIHKRKSNMDMDEHSCNSDLVDIINMYRSSDSADHRVMLPPQQKASRATSDVCLMASSSSSPCGMSPQARKEEKRRRRRAIFMAPDNPDLRALNQMLRQEVKRRPLPSDSLVCMIGLDAVLACGCHAAGQVSDTVPEPCHDLFDNPALSFMHTVQIEVGTVNIEAARQQRHLRAINITGDERSIYMELDGSAAPMDDSFVRPGNRDSVLDPYGLDVGAAQCDSAAGFVTDTEPAFLRAMQPSSRPVSLLTLVDYEKCAHQRELEFEFALSTKPFQLKGRWKESFLEALAERQKEYYIVTLDARRVGDEIGSLLKETKVFLNDSVVVVKGVGRSATKAASRIKYPVSLYRKFRA
jgi:hypothetical protein